VNSNAYFSGKDLKPFRENYEGNYDCYVKDFTLDSPHVEVNSVIGNHVNVKTLEKVFYIVINGMESIDYLPNNVGHFFPNLDSIVIHRSNLKVIERSNFESMPDLTSLDISFCPIAELHEDAFNDLQNLTELSLHNLSLVTLPQKLLWKLEELDELDLSHNIFEHFPDNFFSDDLSSSLTWLSLSFNRITILQERLLWNLENLHDLNLSNNLIECIPSDFLKNNQNIGLIDFSENQLKTIHIDFESLLNLNIFNFTNCGCADFIANLTTLESNAEEMVNLQSIIKNYCAKTSETC